jgi:hypothetical protein
MRTRLLLVSLLLAIMAHAGPANAQRGPADAWELLGEKTVGLGVDRDSIVVNQSEEWFRNRAFRTLRFAAERNDVHLISIRVTYMNGYGEDIRVDQVIRRDGELVVDLRGERSFLRQIDMRYRSNLGLSIGGGGIRLEQAVIRVYGERMERRPGPPAGPPPGFAGPPGGGGWEELDTRRFNRSDFRVVLSAGRGEGRIGQIKLRSTGESVDVRSIQIRFRNGETQSVPMSARLEPGQETTPIDLDGRQRSVESVTVNLEPRRRPGQAELHLLATRRAGGGADQPPPDRYGERGWVALGEKVVGFGVDRDVINIGQSEEWFRNRAFRSLHLVAERNDVHMMNLRIVYLNGVAEDLRVDRLIRAGTDLAVDLRGDRSYIARVEMTYRSRPNFRGQAVVRVYGEPAGRRSNR